MMKRLTLLLAFSFLVAAPALAAAPSLTLTSAAASANAPFTVSVDVDLGGEQANALEGAIAIPDGLTVARIETAGGAIPLFVSGPSYVDADHAVEFTGGTPGTSITGTAHLFTLRLVASAPGRYTLSPDGFFLYRADGKGTRVSLATAPVTIDVATAGSVAGKAPAVSTGPSAPVYAQSGSDPSLFDGKKFVALYGGTDVAYYEVQEGWFHAPVVADHYYVLRDQGQGSILYVTAVSTNGTRTTTIIWPTHPLSELLALAATVLAFVLGIALAAWFISRRLS